MLYKLIVDVDRQGRAQYTLYDDGVHADIVGRDEQGAPVRV